MMVTRFLTTAFGLALIASIACDRSGEPRADKTGTHQMAAPPRGRGDPGALEPRGRDPGAASRRAGAPDGERRAGDGDPTRSDGTPSRPDGTPSRPDGTPSRPDGTPSRPDGTPSRPDGTLATDAARPTAGPGSVLDLPDAPGVTRLTVESAGKAPFVDVSTARVVALARTHCRTLWYGLYLQGKKLGWAEMGCAVVLWNGVEVVERRSRMVMEAQMYAAKVKIEMTTLARFAAKGSGELLTFDHVQDGAQQKKTLTIRKVPTGWSVEQTYRAGNIVKPPVRKVLPRLASTLGTSEIAVTALVVEGRALPGARFRFWELDPEDVVERESAAQILGRGVRVLQGVPTRLVKLEVLELHRKLLGVTLVDEGGNWVDGTVQGTIRIRREEKAFAKRLEPGGGDLGLGAVIRAPLDAKEPRRVRKLRLNLMGYLPPGLSESPRHALKRLGPEEAELTITREPMTQLPTTLLPQLANRFPKELAATEQIESGHPEIRALARRAIAGERHALPAARKLTAFVFTYLAKKLSTNLDSALAISRAKVGDCTEHARLLVALCRSVGLPAREVGGVTWVPDLGGFGYHAWAEVWVGRWVSADPSWNELPANATHIFMGGPEDVQWIGTLGNLKASVLGVEVEPVAD